MGPEWMTEEHRQKISEANKRRISERGHPQKGRITPKETRDRQSAAHLARLTNVGEKNGMYGRTGAKHPSFGKHFSPESVRASAEKHKALWKDPAWRARMIVALQNKKRPTDETRAKQSAAWTPEMRERQRQRMIALHVKGLI